MRANRFISGRGDFYADKIFHGGNCLLFLIFRVFNYYSFACQTIENTPNFYVSNKKILEIPAPLKRSLITYRNLIDIKYTKFQKSQEEKLKKSKKIFLYRFFNILLTNRRLSTIFTKHCLIT